MGYTPDYLKSSDPKFMGSKQKVFFLRGKSGEVLVASGDDGKAVDSLRKTDDLSLSRAGFAICLRDFEAFEQDLEPSAWTAQRKVFFDTVCRHFLSLPKLFNFAPYVPRLFGLGVACRDYKNADKLLKCLHGSIGRIKNDCEICFAGLDDVPDKCKPLEKWLTNLHKSLAEAECNLWGLPGCDCNLYLL
jgi:hypothetical protein